MGFLNFRKKPKTNVVAIPGILPNIDGVEIMFVAQDNTLIYTKTACGHLFTLDKDGDQKLDGRVVSIIYRGQSDKSVIEVFVAFSDEESYGLFSMQLGLQERLASISKAVFLQLGSHPNLFSKTDTYATQFVYTFKMYKKGSRFFMVNNQQTAAYLVDESGIQRGSADKIKSVFWGD
jgi:hypothetical protein